MDRAARPLYLSAIIEALKTQDVLNQRLSQDWTTQGWPYYRAVWTEMAEAVGHLNWMWWKKGAYNKELTAEQTQQLHMELADIFHFGMSMSLIEADLANHPQNLAIEADKYLSGFVLAEHNNAPNILEERMEEFICATIKTKAFDVMKFAMVCLSAKLPLHMLLSLYFAKQALNRFRWDNGYNLPKTDPKHYIKMWPSNLGAVDLVEDNVHLAELVFAAMKGASELETMHNVNSPEIWQFLEAALGRRYPGRHLRAVSPVQHVLI